MERGSLYWHACTGTPPRAVSTPKFTNYVYVNLSSPLSRGRENYQSEVNMGPYEYIVEKIDGDYAVLRRADVQSEDTVLVARALLPEEIDEGTRLLWENLEYSVI